MKKICAIYTRKSTDERLDMEFNTLDAQRESCAAYITSQKSEGWLASKEKYDDGGFSGGSLERPALKRLLDDIKAGKVHIVVVYKIDRLTRSLIDFSKLVEVFDEHGTTFVSITQSFNTTTSMGRLTLNVLLSFAQFEREVSGERIRDKIAASKARGMWMGGVPPVGYKIEHRQLAVNKDEMKLARHIFERYLALGNVRSLKTELDRQGLKSPNRKSLTGKSYGGFYFSRGALYAILKNPAYIGKISHKGKIHEGLQEGIIPLELWERVQLKLKEQTVSRTQQTKRHSMLQGLLFDSEGTLYSPTFTNRHGRQYCYYISQNLPKNLKEPSKTASRLPAHDLEATVEKALRKQVRRLAGETGSTVLDHILQRHENIPAHDLVRSCIERVSIGVNQLTIRVNTTDFQKLAETHLRVKAEGRNEIFEITVPFKLGKEKRGAIMIKSEGNFKDIFDIPRHQLKKLVQGTIWCEDHFSGKTLKEVSHRANCSDTHVRKSIMRSFKILQSA